MGYSPVQMGVYFKMQQEPVRTVRNWCKSCWKLVQMSMLKGAIMGMHYKQQQHMGRQELYRSYLMLVQMSMLVVEYMEMH